MPKIVDHADRRREIAAAVWRVLERDGLRGATVRAVMAESGLSSGAIRHYFASQDDLLRFAGRVVRERVPDRFTATLADPDLTPRQRATQVLAELVPLDHQRRVETRVFAALGELERTRPEDQAFLAQAYDDCRLVARLAVLILAGVPLSGNPTSPLVPELERLAMRLHLVADGLAGRFLFYPELQTAEQMTDELSREVDEVAALLATPSA